MKKRSIAKLGLLLLSITMVLSCKKSEKEVVCNVVKKYADAYYNLDIKRAKEYCAQELHTIMDFRHSNLTRRDYDFQKAAGEARVKVLDCNFDMDQSQSYVSVEVSNFLRINYVLDSLMIVPCDTVELVLVKEVDRKWRIRILE